MTTQRRSYGAKKLLLASATVALIAAPAAAAEMLLACVSDVDPGVRFNVRVNFNSADLMYIFRGNSHRYRAAITADQIEFRGGILVTRISRINGEFVVWNTAGKQLDIGICRKMADRIID